MSTLEYWANIEYIGAQFVINIAQMYCAIRILGREILEKNSQSFY